MIKFCSLYSGSSGNSLLVQSNNTNILIDSGVSGKKVCEALNSLSIDVSSIDAILVTHEHSDHIKSVGILSKKYNIPVFANKETWNAMRNRKRENFYRKPAYLFHKQLIFYRRFGYTSFFNSS